MGNLAINPKQQFFFSGQINELNNHAVEATVSILGLKNPAIRQHLVRELKGEKHLNSNKDALMGDPVFDVLFPWEEQPLKTTQLTSLLHLETIATITGAKEVTEEDKKTAITIATPYKHQLESWQLLNDDSITNSLVVTSGTGSGKTECFMVPILDDLIRQHHETKQRLNGVQALFLYPLNALINSQQERLNKWTRHFDTNIQFCLYNGNTDEKPKQKHNDNKNQIQSRELLRQTPPPILVTNATMLEYMLIRQLDKSIIDKSKGKLKWIVLDEAHSYLGSTASELSLLLKRVMLAFEVEPKNVHFIATSATIGDDEKAKQQLKSFLASLSGTHEQQIHIITAQRAVPPITLSNDSINETTPTLQKIVNIDPAQEVSKLRYQALANHSFAMQLRDKFVKDEIGNKLTQPRDLQTLLQVLSPALTKMMAVEKQLNPRFELSPADYLLKWLDVCSYTKPNDEDAAFLPLRAHVFQRTLAGLYACVNPSCSGKPEILKQSNIHGQAEWEFGYLYTSARHQCDYCDFPVFEVAFCQECQTPHLLAQEDSHNSNKKLAPLSREQPDEFTLNTDIDDNETLLDEQSDDDTSTKLQVLMPVQSSKQQSSISKDDTASNCLYQLQHISPFGEYFTFPKDETVEISIKDIGEDNQKKLKYCYFCDTSSQLKDIIKPIYLGAPFYMSESINTLLDYCKPFEKESDSLPYQGKRMITFTDSRQGTARITMKLRQDSERRTLRHIVYHELAKQINSESSKQKLQEIKEAEEAIQQLIDMNMNQVAIDLLIKQKKQLEKSIANPVMSWSDMTSAIVNHPEFRFLKASIKKVAKIHDIESEKELAELLLLNELARRPRNANSLETLGLVYITYPILDDEIKKIDGFKEWQDLGFDLQDWKDFLKLLLDFYIREEKFVNLSFNQIQSINEKFFGKLELLPPNSEKDFHENDKKYIRTWLKTYASSPNRSRRLVKLLALPKDLNLNDKICQDKINAILVQAWKALTEQTKLLTQTTNLGQKTFQLDFKNVSLTIPQKVYICPITNRFLDTTLKGYTPYLPNKQNLPEILRHKEDYQCKSVQIPVFQGDVMESNHTEEAKNWLKNEPVLLELRNQNLWTDISDSVVAGMNTLVTEEHSAQINQEALKYYENSFKEGKTNILNCSTTMEMGVDIGGISTVAMNNVPPHPANYLQRTGRAGRRKESHAIAYTICKNNPHEQMVFHNTKWAFDTKINPPSITLNSEQILQRHINAYLLGLFLNEQHQHDSSNITLKSGWFFLNWSEESLKRENREALINNILERALKNTDNELSETNSTDKNMLTKEMLEAIFLSKTPYCKMQEWLDTLIHQDTTIDNKLKITKGIERIICQSNVANHHPNTFLQKALEGVKKQKRFIVDKIVNKLLEYHSIRSGKNKNSAYLVKLMIDITGIASTYLLSDLARFGFLPRYGFPAGIVEFDIYNSSYYAQQKKKKRNTPKPKKSEAREDNLSFANGKPMRDLAVALREYAPGNEVAVDGLIYRSAGLELSHFMNKSNANEAQVVRHFAQCRHCGAIDYDVQIDYSTDDDSEAQKVLCSHCNHSINKRDIIDFVEPMGFKVDYISKPHAKIESPTYVPVEDPKIQANSDIVNLPNPKIGNYRIDDNGKIFHHSSGTYGKGYFVCLHCGRAESVTADSKTEAFKEQKAKFIATHIPMKPLSEIMELTDDNAEKVRGACSENGYKTQYLHIGATDTTSVFELYLTDPETQDYLADTEENKTLLLTLAVVLRDELAKCHGISEDELGCGIKPLSIEGKTIQAIFIYDKASGGAGFASTANKYIIKMLINAKKALECKDDCEKACHSCLLTFDTRFIADKLNRHLALDYINKIQPYLQLPDEADLLNNTEYCSSSISERIAEGFQQGFDTITLYLQGNPEQWALTSALHTRIKLWTFNNKNVELVINQTYFDKLLEVDKDYLLSLSKLPDVHLYCWQSDRKYLDNHYLVQLSKSNPSDHKVLTLATTDKNAYIPNNSLWQVELGAYTVEDSTCQKMMVESLPERFYQQQSDKNAKVIDITIQLDGTIKELGSKFWELLDKEKPDGLGQYLKNKVEIKSISYEDSYVSSPFVVLIIGEFLHSLKSLYGHDWSNPRVTVKTSGVSETNKGHKTELGLQLKHNWKDDTTQEKVIERYLKNLGLEASCYINSFKSVSHHRPLTITWDNGNKTTIYLDHGVGFIDYADNNQRRLIEFDFKQNVDEQVKQILRISESALNLKNASNLAIVTVRE